MLPPVTNAVFAPNVVAVPSVIVPLLLVFPMDNWPVVVMVFNSDWESSSVFAVSFTVLPILIELVAVVFCRVTEPEPALIVPPARFILSDVNVIAPLLLLIAPDRCVSSVLAAELARLMLPLVAVLLMLVTVNAPLLVKLIFPLPLLEAVYIPTVFAELSVVPPTELVVSVPVVLIAAVWLIAPDEVREIALVVVKPAVFTVPTTKAVVSFRLIAPVLPARVDIEL